VFQGAKPRLQVSGNHYGSRKSGVSLPARCRAF
jgi:hypothetical protein